MRALLREDVLAGLAACLLGGGSALAAVGLLRERERLGRVARWCAGLGGYLLLLSLVARAVQVRAWPLASTYEVVLVSAAATALVYALGTPRWLSAVGGVCAGLPALLMVVLALLLTPAGARVPQAPPAALQGILFMLHTAASALGYGGLILAGCAAALRLLAGSTGSSPTGGLTRQLQVLAWRGLCWGYPWLTLGMTLGAYWGWTAWGRYWSWGVKEIMTLLTWGLFTMAFHTRRLKGWRGRPYAAVVVIATIVLFLTLLAAEDLAAGLISTTRYIF